MKFRIEIELPEFDYDQIEGHDVESEYEKCDACGEKHNPEKECENDEMISTHPIKKLIDGTHSGLLKKVLKKKDK